LILFQLGEQSGLAIYEQLAGFRRNFGIGLQAAVCTDMKKLMTVFH
jgi:hypothetical protein